MIQVSDLSFSYADKEVLKSITFSVDKGDLFAILGPNGAGKTTLLKILTGLLEVQGGEASINSCPIIGNIQIDLKKQIGIMHEISGVYLKMTGFEYLSLVAALYDYPSHLIKSRVNELCEKYGLEEEIHRIIGKYSSGTKKKIEFCSAIIYEPQVVFLDEPFESIDPTVSYEIKKFLKNLVETGVTVVITSHILETIQNLCNRYMIINGGRVVSQGIIDKQSNMDLEQIFMEAVQNEKSE